MKSKLEEDFGPLSREELAFKTTKEKIEYGYNFQNLYLRNHRIIFAADLIKGYEHLPLYNSLVKSLDKLI
ncbi:MAG: hypothetical protein ACOCZ6_02380 [Nanoarchaeota archaeon]